MLVRSFPGLAWDLAGNVNASFVPTLLGSFPIPRAVPRFVRKGRMTRYLRKEVRGRVGAATPIGGQEVPRLTPFIRLINDVLFEDIDPDALRTTQHF
jgi:hypothetical protein